MEFIQKFKDYLLSQKNAPSKATVKNYLADIHHFISWVEATYQKVFNPQDITIHTIEQFKEAKKQTLSQSSIDRHVSTLRKFFIFITLTGEISHSPFDEASSKAEAREKEDPWHLHDFKNYLYVYNASHLTIKNYLIDVKQFLSWAETVLGTKDAFMVADKDVLKRIDSSLVEEYKTRLIEQHVFSASSINRKLSSLRKYLSWAAEQGYVTQEVDLGQRIQESGVKNTESNTGWQEGRDSVMAELPIQRGGMTGDPARVPGLNLSEGSHRSGVRSDRTPESQNNNSQPREYSKIPPVRLFQKTTHAGTFAFDLLISRPIAHLFRTTAHKKWELQGKPLFVKAPTGFMGRTKHVVPQVKNISKGLYSPLSISIKHLPWYRQALHHIRYTRPTWYRRYHQLALAHYFNWAVLIIFSSAVGFGMYHSFVQTPGKSLAALPNGPLRVLSFQGRLTDANDNPITTPTYVRFTIYNDATASGSAEQWEELDKVTPDSDGIFSLLLGSNGSGGQASTCSSTPATGACGIPQSLFANNNALWLGVTVGNTSELTPREQIATVAFASNAETLQGLPPITQSGAGTQNVVLALNSSGNLAIGASTTFQSTSGQFALSGNTLALNTNAGTNGNITLAPDGTGVVDIQKPIQNTSNYSNIPSAAGAVEIDDLLAVLATSSGQSAFTLNQNSTGPLISASTSGTAKFTVDNAGNTYATAFYPGLGSTYVINTATSSLNSLTLASNLTVSGNVASNLTPSVTNTYSLGTSSNQWLSLYAQNIYSNGMLLANYWQRNSGVISPLYSTDDLAVGGTATSSAKFQIFGNTGNATTSGNLTFTGTGSLIQTTNNQGLTIGGNTTGNITLAPLNGTGILYINGAAQTVGNGGNYTIQTTSNGALNLLSAGSGNIVLGQNAGTGTVLVQPNAGGQAALIVNKQGATGDILTASSSGTTQFTVSNAGAIYGRSFYDLDNTAYYLDPASVTTSLTVAGSVGIGTSSPTPGIGLDIQKNSPAAAALRVNQLAANQDIFTASASGTPKFTVAYNGNLSATGTITGLTGITSSGTIDFTGLSTNGVLQTSGGNGTLTVAAVNLGTEVTGVLPLSNGGTGTNLTADSGGIVYSGASGLQILAHASSTGQCLVSGGTSAPSWASCSTGSGSSYWSLNNGALYPVNTTLDLFVGGTATSSAKFAVLNMNSGTPTASVSATATGTGLSLGGDGTIQSLINSPLTLGGNTTGSIILTPQNGTGTVSIHGSTLDTNASTFSLLPSATTVNIGGSTIDSTQSTVNLFGTPTTLNLGGSSQALTIKGNTTIGNSSSNTLTITSQINSNVIPYTASGNTSSYSLGDPNHMWQNIYAANIYAPVSGGTNGFWALANNVIYPANYTSNDLAIGGTATSSAKFQVFAETVGTTTAGTASTSGNLVFHGTSAAINLLNGNGLTVNASVGGDSALSSIVTISNSGDLSLNGNLTLTGGTISSTATTNNIFTGSAGTINLGKSTTTVNIPGNVTLGTSSSNNLTISGDIASNLVPLTDNNYYIGNTTNQWAGIYTHNLYLPVSGGTGGYWTLSNSVVSPTNIWNDLAIGGSATSSAKFQIFANTVAGEPAGTASTSGELTFSTNSQVNLLNNAGLGFYNSVGGDAGLSTSPALYVANSGNIGIGTNNPANPLTVAGTSGDVANFASNSTSSSSNYISVGGGRGLLGYNGNWNVVLQGTGGKGILFNVNNNTFGNGTAMDINSNGDVGIGTTTFGNAQLVVNQTNTSGLGDIFSASSSGTTEFTIANDGTIKNSIVPNVTDTYNLGSATNEWNNLYVRQIITPSTGGIAGYWQLNSGVLSPSNITNDLTVGGTATSSAKFQVFGNTGNVYTAGNVGIQVSNPTFSLQVNGTALIGTPPTSSYYTAAPLNLANNAGGTLKTQLDLINGGGGSGAGSAIDFYTYTDQSSSTGPGARFGAIDDGSYSGNIVFDTKTPGSPSNAILERMRITSSGNVGIGTTNPANKLDVQGSFDASGSATIYTNLNTNSSDMTFRTGAPIGTNNTQYTFSTRSNNTDFWLYEYDGSTYWNPLKSIYSNKSIDLNPDGAGSVGIGTVSPLSSSGLDIEKNGLGNSILDINQLGSGDIFTASASGITEFQVTNSGNVYGRKFTDLDNPIYYLDPAGLTISASIAGSMTFTPASEHDINYLNGSAINFQGSVGGDAGLTSTMYLSRTGNVGIGTTSPGSGVTMTGGLTINGTGNTQFTMQKSGTNGLAINIGQTTAGDVNFYDAVGGSFHDDLTLNNGNVGIGATSPYAELYLGNASTLYSSKNWGRAIRLYTGNAIEWDSGEGNNSTMSIGQSGSTLYFAYSNYTTPGTGYTDYPLQVSDGSVTMQIYAGGYSHLVCKSNSGGGVSIIGTCGSSYTYGDFAENIAAANTDQGDIVTLDSSAIDNQTATGTQKVLYGRKATTPYDNNLLGGISISGMGYEPNYNLPVDPSAWRQLSVAGVIPIKVSTINGPIHQGDPITSSVVPGVGMKATNAGMIVGRATEDFDDSQATQAARLINNQWTVTDGACQIGENNCYNEGKVLTIVNTTLFSPNAYLTSTGDFQLAAATPSADFSVPTYYTLNDALGNPISQMGALAELVVGNLRAGSIQAQQTITNTLAVATDNVSIAGQSLRDYILSVVKNAGISTVAVSQTGSIKTDVISPLASGSAIAIRLNNSRVEIAKDATGSAVASIDNAGNATFSGQLNSQNLAVNGDATVSGTLHANKIEANSIVGLQALVSTLSAQNVTIINNNYAASPTATPILATTATGSGNLSSTTSGALAISGTTAGFANIASFSGYLSYVPSLQATTGMFEQGLVSLGPTSLTDTSIQGQLSVGSQLILADNSLNVLGSDFAIQPLRQGGVNFEGGLVAINTNGDLTVNGNAIFNQNLAVNTLSPIPGHDLQINLSNNAATGSAQPQLKINDASGSAVFAINQMGDLMASGAANISKLNFNLVQPALAVSDTEVVATGSAGTASIKAFQKEVTIDDVNVTDKSLIYITPVGTDQTPYLERQVAGTSFTVGIPVGTPNAVNFNWLIVN